ncbi:MAG TPA: lysophospholipid acyltransferase family protein [Thermoanaerobaculia bacterium]|nr:lysophospholipid acyltransferase family protein [Thermoanaerobaculia bacterium]
MIERALRGVSRAGLFVFFRARDVAGLENVPAEGPVLLVPNHTNAFVDALVVAAALPRRVTLTAKSTLFAQPVLSSILRGLGAIPLHRRQDREQGADPSANIEALVECRRRLSRGDAICLFPEGVSHSDPSLRPLRTGAARIALDFVEQESRTLAIVPVGLHYEAKERFRSAVSARFGEPIDVAAWRERHPGARARELTAEIETRLRGLTLNARRRRELALFRWTAEVLATRGLPPPVLGREKGAAADRAVLAGLVSEGYEKLESSHGEEIRGLEERVRRYHTELRRLGIAPDEVYLEMNAGRAGLFVIREIETLLVGAPLALLGTLLHGPAFGLTRDLVARFSSDRDHWATNAVGFGAVLLPLCAALELVLAWTFLTWPWALALTVLLPYSGIYLLLYRDRAGGVVRRTRTFLRLLFRRGLQTRLAEEGRGIIAAIESLAAQLPAEAAPHP